MNIINTVTQGRNSITPRKYDIISNIVISRLQSTRVYETEYVEYIFRAKIFIEIFKKILARNNFMIYDVFRAKNILQLQQ